MIIGDDLESQQSKKSKVIRAKIKNWFYDQLLPCGDVYTNVLTLGTVLHKQCLVQLIADNNPTFDSTKIKAVESWPRNKELWSKWNSIYCDSSLKFKERLKKSKQFYIDNKLEMDKGFKCYWPEKFNALDLHMLRLKVGFNSFDQEYNGSTSIGTGWFDNKFVNDSIVVNHWPAHHYCRVLTVDPSQGGQGSDYTSICDAMLGDNLVFYAKSTIKRLKPVEIAFELVSIIEDSFDKGVTYDSIVIEGNANQVLLSFPIQECLKKANDRRNALGKPPLHFKVDWLTNSIAKEIRIKSLEPHFNRGAIKLMGGDYDIMLSQLRDFPDADHDDGPDSLATAVASLISIYNKLTKEAEKPW